MATTIEEKSVPVVVKQGWIKKKGMTIFLLTFDSMFLVLIVIFKAY